MTYEPIDPAKAVSRLKLKFTAHKQGGSNKSTGGSAAQKTRKFAGLRPRRKAYGPF